MNYIPLQDFKLGWIFRHRELPIPESALAMIKPLTTTSANQFWRDQISREATHANHFLSDDWPAQNGIWLESMNWQARWESDFPDMPELLEEHCHWEGNTRVFFCYDVDHIVETTWAVFSAHWKNFLFYDDEPILIGKNRRQVALFHSDGSCQIGNRLSGK
ncbi:MAG: DUF2947 domain-containing protein [Oceanobacter sp.]